MALPRKKLLFISRSPPYGATRARALLDMALAASIYEQDIELLFLGDGVYQLLTGQDAAGIHMKTLGKALTALAHYGIEKPGVEAAALAARGLDQSAPLIPVETLSADQISERIARADVVFNL